MEVYGFILFLIYTVGIFFIKDYYILAIIFIINCLLMFIFKIDVKKAVLLILKLLPFIIFTTIINALISGLSYGIIIGIRLILVCNITYIFSKKMTSQKLQYVIEKLLKPLSIIRIDSKEIGLMVCIGITFIPILKNEIIEIKYALKSKGFYTNFWSIIKKPNYILVPLVTSIMKRVGQIEDSLISKGYMN